MMRLFKALASLGALVAVVATASACVVDATPRRSNVQFDETTNLGYRCGSPLTSWTVSNRDTGEQGEATCEQPVLFLDLDPDVLYTFDIRGYTNGGLCWEGSCEVVTSRGGTVYPDCSRFVRHLCGF